MGKDEKKFLYECQSTADSSMLVRIFEYTTQIALDQGEIDENTLKEEILVQVSKDIHDAIAGSGYDSYSGLLAASFKNSQ